MRRVEVVNTVNLGSGRSLEGGSEVREAREHWGRVCVILPVLWVFSRSMFAQM